MRPLIALWCLTVGSGLLLFLMPEPRRYPLVAADGWEATSGFTRTPSPTAQQVSSEILASKDAVYWRSWDPGTGSVPGRLVSKPFPLPDFLSIPYVGYAGHPDIALYVECVATGKRIHIATANAHEQWVEVIMKIPGSWCASQGRLVAESRTTDKYVGVGTPFTASFASWMKESLFSIVFIHSLMFALLGVAGVAVSLLLRHVVRADEYFLLMLIVATTALGYVAFFIYDASSTLGFWFSVCTAAGGAAALLSPSRRGELVRLFRSNTEIRAPLICFYLISLGYVLLLYSVDTGAGSYNATYRYSPASWSTDNQLSQMVAEEMVTGPRRAYTQVFGTGGWKVSDRPPALTGIFLLLRPVFGAVFPFGENRHLTYYFYQIGGIIVMSSWILPFWLLCRKMGMSARRTFLTLTLVASSAFAIFNSTYIWPKMNAAALALGAFVLLVQEPLTTGKKPSLRRTALGGGMLALAMLCHGGVIFGLAALALLLCRKRFFPGWKPAAAGALVFLATMLPWTIWQRAVDPPGNALTKYALAGTFGFGEDSLSVLDTVRRSYSKLTLHDWVAKKRDALGMIAGLHTANLYSSSIDITDRWRVRDFYFVIPSLNVLNAGWIIAILRWLRFRRSKQPENGLRNLTPLLFVGVTGVLLNVLVTWDLQIIHHNSYLSILALAIGLAILIASERAWWGVVLVGAQFGYCLLVWVCSPLAIANRVNCGILAGWVAVTLATWRWSVLTLPTEAEERADGTLAMTT